MAPFGMLCGAVATALTPFGTPFWDPLGSLRSYLGRQVTLEAELWGHTKFCNQNKQIR